MFFIEARADAEETRHMLQAHFTAALMNVHLPKGKTIKGKDLYSPLKEKVREVSDEEKRAAAKAAVDRFGPQAKPVNISRLAIGKRAQSQKGRDA